MRRSLSHLQHAAGRSPQPAGSSAPGLQSTERCGSNDVRRSILNSAARRWLKGRLTRAPLRRAAGAILISLMLVGCASRPGTGVLKPVEYSAPGAKLVTVYVATTRQRAALGENIFTAGRSPSLNLARYTISIPPAHKKLEIEWPQGGAVDPAISFATVSHAALTDADFKLAVQLGPLPRAKREVVIFVHGYNYNFQSLFIAWHSLLLTAGSTYRPFCLRGLQRVLSAGMAPTKRLLIPSPIDQNPCAHSRSPMDMMRQG